MKKNNKKEYIPLVPEKEKIRETKFKHTNSKIYVDFTTRVIITFIIFFIVLISSFILIYKSFRIEKLNNIVLEEKSNFSYKVFLNKNDIYEKEYLEEGLSYITDLIKELEINLKYNLSISGKSSYDIKYQILGDLIIEDKKDSNKVYYKNTYILSDTIVRNIENEQSYEINKTLSLDYWYYNGLSNKFNKDYEVETTSYLEVYLDIKEETTEDNFYQYETSTRPSIKIPLSEKDIKIDINDVNNSKRVADYPKVSLRSMPLLLLGIVLLIASIIIIIQIKLQIDLLKTKKSIYDKELDNILTEYDEIIINTKTPPRKEEYKEIKVESFKELLDVYNQVKEPIKYHLITEHTKSEFYINHNDEIYIFTLKSVDLENEK